MKHLSIFSGALAESQPDTVLGAQGEPRHRLRHMALDRRDVVVTGDHRKDDRRFLQRERGAEADARALFDRAETLWPESWAIKRQAWNLEHPLKSFGPDFWGAVDRLGDRPYYEPLPDIRS